MLEALRKVLEAILSALGGPTVAGPVRVPGIAAADALDANDAMGLLFWFPVPKQGIITGVIFYDLDNEKIAKELVLSPVEFTATASDAVFAPSAKDLLNMFSIRIAAGDYGTGFSGNALGEVYGLNIPYSAPEGKLYAQLVTRGADSIVADADPQIALLIL